MPATATKVTRRSADSNDGVLAKIDRATSFLAEARSLQEVNSVIAMAEAATIYAKRMNASKATIAHAQEIQLRAERKLGEILALTPKAKGTDRAGRPSKLDGQRKLPSNSAPTLKEIGIDKNQSSRAQKLASVPEPIFEEALVIARAQELSPSQVRAGLATPKPIQIYDPDDEDEPGLSAGELTDMRKQAANAPEVQLSKLLIHASAPLLTLDDKIVPRMWKECGPKPRIDAVKSLRRLIGTIERIIKRLEVCSGQ